MFVFCSTHQSLVHTYDMSPVCISVHCPIQTQDGGCKHRKYSDINVRLAAIALAIDSFFCFPSYFWVTFEEALHQPTFTRILFDRAEALFSFSENNFIILDT